MRRELLDLCPWVDWRLRIKNRLVVSLEIFVEEGQYVRLRNPEIVKVVPFFIRSKVEQCLICEGSMDESGQAEEHYPVAASGFRRVGWSR